MPEIGTSGSWTPIYNLSYSCAPPFGPAMLVTHGPRRTFGEQSHRLAASEYSGSPYPARKTRTETAEGGRRQNVTKGE